MISGTVSLSLAWTTISLSTFMRVPAHSVPYLKMKIYVSHFQLCITWTATPLCTQNWNIWMMVEDHPFWWGSLHDSSLPNMISGKRKILLVSFFLDITATELGSVCGIWYSLLKTAKMKVVCLNWYNFSPNSQRQPLQFLQTLSSFSQSPGTAT